MENNISERISVGSRQTSITRTSQYSKRLAIETQSQSSESSRTSGYGSFTNGSVPNGHQISVASQSQYLLDGQDTDLIQSKGLVTSQVSRVSFSHLILSTTIHYPNLLFYWACIHLEDQPKEYNVPLWTFHICYEWLKIKTSSDTIKILRLLR